MNIAVIPARAGSKRIPHKNIKRLGGVPVIAYAIKAAQDSGLFGQIYVSTDSQEIANIATYYGASVPYLREANLSDDYATTISVISDFVSKLKSELQNIEYVCCIYPVTPMLRSDRIIEAYKILKSENFDYVFPVKNHETSLLRSFEVDSTNRPVMITNKFESTRSQDLPNLFHDAGQFYWGRKTAWENQKPIFSGNSSVIEIGKWEAIDVDTIEDWDIVEGLLSLRSE